MTAKFRAVVCVVMLWFSGVAAAQSAAEIRAYIEQYKQLALDQENYPEVLRLYEEASAAGYHAGNAAEMRPFIKAAAYTGDWDQALAWSESANGIRPDQTSAYFGKLWEILERETPASEGKTDAGNKAKSLFAVK